jgi:Flp pilus assembly protein TadB
MTDALRISLLLGVAGALPAIVYLWRRIHILESTRARLAEPDPWQATARPLPPRTRPFVRRHRWLPWLVAGLTVVFLYFLAAVPLMFAATFALVVGLLANQLESLRVDRITLRIEEQLADAIDLMVAALRVGSGALSALEAVTAEARYPLRPQLDEVLGRIRYGDDPQAVLRALERRVPLETFRLFASALSVHWETGGSLTATLASVGRVIRDRIEVNRRIRSLTTQARASIIAISLITYFIALIIWRNDPERMRQFLATSIGQGLAAGAILLQAVGLVWTAALSRMKY